MEQRLVELSRLRDSGMLSDSEYASARQTVISNFSAAPSSRPPDVFMVPMSELETPIIPASGFSGGGAPTSSQTLIPSSSSSSPLPSQQQQPGVFGAGSRRGICRCGEALNSVSAGSEVLLKPPDRVCDVCHVAVPVGGGMSFCSGCRFRACSTCAAAPDTYLTVIPQPYTGILDCAQDCGTFWSYVFCLHCMLHRSAQSALGYSRPATASDPHPGVPVGCTGRMVLKGGMLCLLDLLTLGCCSCWNICSERQRINRKYRIEDDDICCGAVMSALLCRWCVGAANHREMTARGHFPGGLLCSKYPSRNVVGLKPPCPPKLLPQKGPDRPKYTANTQQRVKKLEMELAKMQQQQQQQQQEQKQQQQQGNVPW